MLNITGVGFGMRAAGASRGAHGPVSYDDTRGLRGLYINLNLALTHTIVGRSARS